MPQDTTDIRNLRDFWGYFNAQVEAESEIYAALKLDRMIESTKNFVSSVNTRVNKTLGSYIDLSTKSMMLESYLRI